MSVQQQKEFPQPIAAANVPTPFRLDPSPTLRLQRQKDLRERIRLCKKLGLRTLFHFGAPYNAHGFFGDGPPNCISDPKVVQRYLLLLDTFAREFPGVDDILVYTYDQCAWLCSEFGPCPRCLGVPLHQRLVPFLDQLTAAWRKHSPQGRLWWEPWELSAGQALQCVEHVRPEGFGLALHCNVAEVMAALPVDRWFKNTSGLALRRGIPVIGEYFLGACSEELEPLLNLSHPLVTLRGVKAIASVPGVVGIKEYYGLAPDREDPNLRMAGLFFHNPGITEDEAIHALARPYGQAAEKMVHFWRLTSEGMEVFPWDTSWFIREIGRSQPDHSMSAATLRGMTCHTPSWCSTRHAIFMRAGDSQPLPQPDPWMLEDVQLRCELAADRMTQALELGNKIHGEIPPGLSARFAMNLSDLGRFKRRALAYAYHLRETNLSTVMRTMQKENHGITKKTIEELLALLKADLENFRADQASSKAVSGVVIEAPTWTDMTDAIALLQRDVTGFLQTYFTETPRPPARSLFSLTSP